MRNLMILLVILLVLAGGGLAWLAEQPVRITPALDWQASITSPDFTVRSFTVPVEGAEIEAMILLPVGAEGPTGAVVFTGGSGHGLFQNYAPGFLKTHIQDVFLPRGLAVVYANKRGMGASTGNWMNNTIEGRAKDIMAVADTVRAMPEIHAARVGLAGHSQGGWVVVRAAAHDPRTAFVLNLMGPLRPTWDQFDFMWHAIYTCDGMTADAVDRAFRRKAGLTRVAMAIGRVLPIGMLEFDARFFAYETDGLLARVKAPLLSVYGGADILVHGPSNEAYLQAQFPQGVPAHIRAATIAGVNHRGYRTPDICDETAGQGPEDAEPGVKAAIENWLTQTGY